MTTLLEQLGEGDKRQEVIEDACRTLDQEVSDKSGISGMAIKSAYKLVQGVSPGFIRHVVDHLLDDFLRAIDPVYQEAVQKGEAVGPYLLSRRGEVAEALLAVTDDRARNARRAMIKKTYEKLRPTAKKHVEAAAPRLAQLLERHATP